MFLFKRWLTNEKENLYSLGKFYLAKWNAIHCISIVKELAGNWPKKASYSSDSFTLIFIIDIRRRLEQLGQRVPGKDNSADLLAELRAQEERNQKSLNDLRRQLFEMGQKRVNVMWVHNMKDFVCNNMHLKKLKQWRSTNKISEEIFFWYQ